MNKITKSLLSFFALVGFAVLLLADSAEPYCNGYHPLAVTLTYETNCSSDGSTQTGTIEFDLPATGEESEYLSPNAAESEWEGKMMDQAKAGGLEIRNLHSSYCTENGERLYIRAVSLSFPGSIVCPHVSITEPSSVECYVYTYNKDARVYEKANEVAVCKIEIEIIK